MQILTQLKNKLIKRIQLPLSKLEASDIEPRVTMQENMAILKSPCCGF
jgi:hypothetical protein